MVALDFAETLNHMGGGLRPGNSLDGEQACELFGAMLDGKLPPLQLGAFLMALRWKKESAEELSGFARAANSRCQEIILPPGLPRAVVIPSGYSDLPNSLPSLPNLTPLLALMLARFGLPVIVHGSTDPDTRSHSFELLAALGHPAVTRFGDIERDLALHNLAVVPTALLLPGLDRLLGLRRQLGVSHTAHLVSRLLDPCPGRSLRLVCVSDPGKLDRLRACLEQEPGRALLMRSTNGEAYANPSRRPRIEFFADGANEELFSASIGEVSSSARPRGRGTAETAAAITDLLEGVHATPQPLLNQLAACLYASGHCSSLAHAKASVALGSPLAV